MKPIRQKLPILSLIVLFCGVQAVGGPPSVKAVIQPQQTRMDAPAFTLQNGAGKFTSLSSLRGHVVLLDFWATECGGCKYELPYFMEFDKQYRSKGLRTLGISMEIFYQDLPGPAEAWARVKPFVKDHGLDYPVLMADEAMSKAFEIGPMPVTFLVDKKGRIAAKYVGVVDKADIEANIQMLMAER